MSLDFAETFNAPIIEKVAGVEVSFPIIPVSVLGQTLGASAKKNKRDRALETIKEFNLGAQEKLVIAKDASLFFLTDIQEYVTTPTGSIEAIRVSLGKVGNRPTSEVDEILNKMSPYAISDMALLVCQFFTKSAEVKTEEAAPVTPPEQPKQEESVGYGDK